jgi:hypothetical protein
MCKECFSFPGSSKYQNNFVSYYHITEGFWFSWYLKITFVRSPNSPRSIGTWKTMSAFVIQYICFKLWIFVAIARSKTSGINSFQNTFSYNHSIDTILSIMSMGVVLALVSIRRDIFFIINIRFCGHYWTITGCACRSCRSIWRCQHFRRFRVSLILFLYCL